MNQNRNAKINFANFVQSPYTNYNMPYSKERVLKKVATRRISEEENYQSIQKQENGTLLTSFMKLWLGRLKLDLFKKEETCHRKSGGLHLPTLR